MENTPTGVKIVSIVYYISAAMSTVIGLAIIFGSTIVSGYLKSFPALQLAGNVLFGFFAVLFLVFALINFIVGRGLSKGKNWSRILVILLSIFGIFLGLSAVFAPEGIKVGLPILVIDGLIFGYFGFSKQVKAFFKGTSQQ